MCSYVIETKRLTKKYGEQTAVNAVNIHVEKGGYTDCWGVMELAKPQ